MEILFVFDDTATAIAAEQLLLQSGVAVRVMSLPSTIRAGCGICLRVSPAARPAAEAHLKTLGSAAYRLYARIPGDKVSQYTPLI